MDIETLKDIRRICAIVLKNNFGHHELDSLCFTVSLKPDILFLNNTEQETKQ